MAYRTLASDRTAKLHIIFHLLRFRDIAVRAKRNDWRRHPAGLRCLAEVLGQWETSRETTQTG